MTNRSPALVTGASSGIGREVARQFATNDFDVVVVAEDAELTTAAAELRGTGATVPEVRADLRSPQEVERLWHEVTALGRPLDNVKSTVQLAELVLRDMHARDEGRLLITSLMPGPTGTEFFARATCSTPRSARARRTTRRRWPSRASRR